MFYSTVDVFWNFCLNLPIHRDVLFLGKILVQLDFHVANWRGRSFDQQQAKNCNSSNKMSNNWYKLDRPMSPFDLNKKNYF